MRDTPIPEARLELDRLRVAAALQRAHRCLLTRPRPQAPDVAQATLFPLLHSLGVDIFDLGALRLVGEPTFARSGFRMTLGGEVCRIEVLAAGERLPPAGSEVGTSDWTLITNGRSWRAESGDGRSRLELELFDENFPLALAALLEVGQDLDTRLERAGELLVKAGEGAVALERIDLAEVREHARQVRHLHGKLQANFDSQPVEITSRSALYYVLAALALQHGREDAIPSDDLIRPPDEPPDQRRARALVRPGWHLLLDHDPGELEERTSQLLDALGLRESLTATLRGHPYPSGD